MRAVRGILILRSLGLMVLVDRMTGLDLQSIRVAGLILGDKEKTIVRLCCNY